MKILKGLLKTLKYIFLIIAVPFIIIFIVSIGLTIINPSRSDGYIEIPIKSQGIITDKKAISGWCDNDYFFTLNGTAEIQVCICLYNEFKVGEYIYLNTLGGYSRDGESFFLILCHHPEDDECSAEIALLLMIIVVIGAILSIIIEDRIKDYLKKKNDKKAINNT